MELAFKYRIYPNKKQQILIHKTCGCIRYIHNYFLNLQNSSPEFISYNQLSKQLTSLKRNLTWLNEVDSTALQSKLRDLDTAFKNMFRNPAHFGYPRFESKHAGYKSYRSKNNNNSIAFSGKYIKLPKLGRVKTKNKLIPTGIILNATVSIAPSGRYYVSLCCKDVTVKQYKKHNNHIGIDLGLKEFAILSNGQKIKNPQYYVKSQKKLARLQRRLSRKPKDSHNYNKARRKLAKLHEHVKNQRIDFLQKLSTKLIQNYDVISLETLKVHNMVKNHCLAKSISDVAWNSFVLMLQYKSKIYNKIISLIDTWYPSSQLCHVCGFRFKGTKDLKIREWICPNCNSLHDRDINAAINIDCEGLRRLSLV